VGGKLHLRLNIDRRPIANKYREGKLQRTLKRELKVLETVVGETVRSVDSVFTGPGVVHLARGQVLCSLVRVACIELSWAAPVIVGGR